MSLVRGVVSLSAGGLIGKVLGLVRESLLAFWFGTSEVAAASRLAQTTIFSPLNLVTTDALSGSYLPLESRLLRDDPVTARSLHKGLQRAFVVVGLALIVAVFVWGDVFLRLIAPDVTQSLRDTALAMAIAMSLGAPAYLHANLLCYLDMAHGNFALSTVRSSVQSVGMILGVAAAAAFDRPSLIGWGFSAAYVAMSLFGTIYCQRRGYLTVAPDEPTTSHRTTIQMLGVFLRRFRILIALPILAQAQVVAEKYAAASINAQAIAAVDYARVIAETGMIALAVPMGLASLSTFSRVSRQESKPLLIQATEPFLILAIGMAATLVCFSSPIVSLLLGRGAFGGTSVDVTARILVGLGLGLWAQMLVYYLVRVLNAQLRNRTSLAIMVIFATVAIGGLAPLVSAYGELGLGLAFSTGAIVGALVALVALELLPSASRTVIRLIPALVVTSLAATQSRSLLIELPVFCIIWILNAWSFPSARRAATQMVQRMRNLIGRER